MARFHNGSVAEGRIDLRFDVGDENDNPPVFVPVPTATINESSPIGKGWNTWIWIVRILNEKRKFDQFVISFRSPFTGQSLLLLLCRAVGMRCPVNGELMHTKTQLTKTTKTTHGWFPEFKTLSSDKLQCSHSSPAHLSYEVDLHSSLLLITSKGARMH